VFLTGFIKIYAQYLELDTSKVLALYRRSNPRKSTDKVKEVREEIFTNRKKKALSFLNPKSLLTIFLITFLLLVVGYIGFQIYKFQSPPKLLITQPQNESTITSENILLKGETSKEVTLEINGTAVEIEDDGSFQKEIALKEGSNTVIVKVRKNSSLERVEVVKITYVKDTEDVKKEEKEDIVENTITVEVFDSPAWVRLDIDDENKLSEVIQPSKQEFTIKEKLYIITGRVSNTKVLYNGETIQWQTNQGAGVAELTCEIADNQLSCE
jgi:cytoskeletal protein RodZ